MVATVSAPAVWPSITHDTKTSAWVGVTMAPVIKTTVAGSASEHSKRTLLLIMDLNNWKNITVV